MTNSCEKLSSKLIRIIQNSYWPKGCILHWCPACNEVHPFAVDEAFRSNNARWSFNGNAVAPTFSPSMNISAGDRFRCHYFLRDGRIEYLGDCTHELKGQTVALPDIPEIDTRVLRYTSAPEKADD